MSTVCLNPSGAPCFKRCDRRRKPEDGDTVRSFDNWNDECAPLRPQTFEEARDEAREMIREFRKDLNL